MRALTFQLDLWTRIEGKRSYESFALGRMLDPRSTQVDWRFASIRCLTIAATARTRFARSRPTRPEPSVTKREEDPGDAISIGGSLFVWRFPDAVIQDVGNGDGRPIGVQIGDGMTILIETLGRICYPPGDRFFPDIPLVAVSLFRLSELVKFRRIEPPGIAGAKAFDGFGPELIAVADDRVDFDLSAAADRPESPSASGIDEVFLVVGGSGEDALARGSNQTFSVRRAEGVQSCE